MKKIIFTLFMFTLISVYVFTVNNNQVSAAYSPNEGDLVKLSSDSAIYYIGDKGERRLFVNEVTFWSWYSGTWNDQNIKTIAQEDFDKLKLGENIRIRPGTNLIKFENSNNIYTVTPGNKLCKSSAHYGSNWNDRLVTIQNGFEIDYIKNPMCKVDENSKLPKGTVFQYKGSTQTYYIGQDSRKRIVTDEGFNLNKFKDEFIVKNVPTSMTFYDNIPKPLDSKELWIDDKVLDLTIGDFVYMLPYSSSDKATFIVEIIQEEDLDQNIDIELYIDNVLVKTINRIAHRSEQYQITWENPVLGEHVCKIVIDSSDQVDESNENNNSKEYNCYISL